MRIGSAKRHRIIAVRLGLRSRSAAGCFPPLLALPALSPLPSVVDRRLRFIAIRSPSLTYRRLSALWKKIFRAENCCPPYGVAGEGIARLGALWAALAE